MTTPDPLTILTRAIDAYHGAPPNRQDVLWTRLMRLTAPVMEERERLLTFLPKAYDWLDAHPDATDYEDRTDTWIVKLQRYQEIENVLGTFPGLGGPLTSSPTPRPSGTPHTEPLPMPLIRSP